MEDCKTNIDNNNINSNQINNDNNKTYNNYNLRLKLNSNNCNNKTNDDIINDYFITDKNDNNNISIEANYNNNISYEESSNKNIINKVDLISEENKYENKQFLEKDNKLEKEEDIIPNISSIENKTSPIKYDTLNKQNIIESSNKENKENININNIKKKPLIQEPNILKSTKIQALKQKINKRNSKDKKNNEIARDIETNNQNDFNPGAFKKDDKLINYNTNNNNSLKNKLYHYLTNFEDWKNNTKTNYNYNNLQLNLLRRKIRNKNITDSERTPRLTYVGLKRYQNLSLNNLSQIQKGIDTYYMINDNINKVNNLKREINNITNTNNTNDIITNQKFYDILKKNKGFEDIFTNIVKPTINNKNKKHYNKILNQLNKTIERLPKNEGNLGFDKININHTFRKYSNPKIYEISPIGKNRKKKFEFLDNINYTKTNNINEKNKKLMFESKMNNMNNTINQLLKITPEFNLEKRITFPANNFRKTKTISKMYKSRKNSTILLI